MSNIKNDTRPYGAAPRFADTLFAWWLLRKAAKIDRATDKLKK